MTEKISEEEHRYLGQSLHAIQLTVDEIVGRVQSTKPRNDLNISRASAAARAIMDLRSALESTMFSENPDLFANRDTNGARFIYFPDVPND